MPLLPQTKTPVGFLWEKKDAGDNLYLGGVIDLGLLGQIPVVIFREQNKTSPKAADWVVRVAIDRRSD